MVWDRQGQMGLVGSGTKAIAQHLISGLAEVGPDVSPQGAAVGRALCGARQQAKVLEVSRRGWCPV